MIVRYHAVSHRQPGHIKLPRAVWRKHLDKRPGLSSAGNERQCVIALLMLKIPALKASVFHAKPLRVNSIDTEGYIDSCGSAGVVRITHILDTLNKARAPAGDSVSYMPSCRLILSSAKRILLLFLLEEVTESNKYEATVDHRRRDKHYQSTCSHKCHLLTAIRRRHRSQEARHQTPICRRRLSPRPWLSACHAHKTPLRKTEDSL